MIIEILNTHAIIIFQTLERTEMCSMLSKVYQKLYEADLKTLSMILHGLSLKKWFIQPIKRKETILCQILELIETFWTLKPILQQARKNSVPGMSKMIVTSMRCGDWVKMQTTIWWVILDLLLIVLPNSIPTSTENINDHMKNQYP